MSMVTTSPAVLATPEVHVNSPSPLVAKNPVPSFHPISVKIIVVAASISFKRTKATVSSVFVAPSELLPTKAISPAVNAVWLLPKKVAKLSNDRL